MKWLCLLVTAACFGQQGQINISLGDEGKIPEIRRTDPRDEPALVRIVESKSPGAMSALFSLGYLKDPQPRTRELLRESARSAQVLTSYPAICSLWRIDDAEWQTLANAALRSLTRTQQMHIASLLFRAGDFAAWPMMRERLIAMLAVENPDERIKNDAFGMLASAWGMKDADGREGAALRDLQAQLAKSPEADRERASKALADFDPKSAPRIQY